MKKLLSVTLLLLTVIGMEAMSTQERETLRRQELAKRGKVATKPAPKAPVATKKEAPKKEEVKLDAEAMNKFKKATADDQLVMGSALQADLTTALLNADGDAPLAKLDEKADIDDLKIKFATYQEMGKVLGDKLSLMDSIAAAAKSLLV